MYTATPHGHCYENKHAAAASQAAKQLLHQTIWNSESESAVSHRDLCSKQWVVSTQADTWLTGPDLDQIPLTADWDRLEQYEVSKPGAEPVDYLYGYVTSHRSAKVHFLIVADPHMRRTVQVVCPPDALPNLVKNTKKIEPHTPVLVRGKIVEALRRPNGDVTSNTLRTTDQYIGQVTRIGHIEVQAEQVWILNSFPSHFDAKHTTNFPPEMRHMSFRTNHQLRNAMLMRSTVKQACTGFLLGADFIDIETPVLFKSTPEGAREFVVPTRRKGLAYALPQSPQQYKQVLMASGIHRYFQFARCFRDEDLRADRQPEFTQLDLEMSFAGSSTVMATIEALVLGVVWPKAERMDRLPLAMQKAMSLREDPSSMQKIPDLVLPVWTYQEAMLKYGSDKPDPRLGAEIIRVDDWIPTSLRKMLTDLHEPIIEMFRIATKDQNPAKSRDVMASFMNLSSSVPYIKNADGMAGISIYDPSSPLAGLAAFGHEGAAEVEERFQPEEGDILIAMCRPNEAFAGGSTILGNFRRDLLAHSVEQGLISPAKTDSLLWVTDFPLFSPLEDDAPGQEGAAGICSTHHPFTAPRADQDLSRLLRDPLSIVGDHYDLVINGTEVGGGSRRIHDAKMQELVFREVLKMKSERVEDFRHLLNALDAGCPPHAGFALGFDRLMTLLLDKDSVRDVIAFPKWGDGDDKFVGSPSPLTSEQLSIYHLKVTDEIRHGSEPKVSIAA